MNNVSDKFLKLMDELRQATIEGKITWEETADESQFRALLKPGMVRIGRQVLYSEDGDITTTYSITLLNREGRVVKEFMTPEPYLEQIGGPFKLPRRTAMKASNFSTTSLPNWGNDSSSPEPFEYEPDHDPCPT